MLRLNTFRKFLSQQKISNGSGQIDSDIQGVLEERVKIRQEFAKKHK